MSSTSSRHADFVGRENRATLHAQRDGEWVVGDERQPDAQSPAGGVSSSVTDLAQWMRLLLADGAHDGSQLISPDALAEMFTPRGPIAPSAHARQPHDHDRVRHRHRGRSHRTRALVAFGCLRPGAATNVTMLPSEGLGIAVLTNGWPVGMAEAVAASFMDLAEQGRVTFDWLAGYGRVHRTGPPQHEPPVRRHASERSRAARPASDYAGTYENDFYGAGRCSRATPR